MRPCCEALERVSRTEEGRAAFEERGTGGVLLATIRFGGCVAPGLVDSRVVSVPCETRTMCFVGGI